jgi:hypothetical protein
MNQDEIIDMARQAGFRVADQFAAAGTEDDMVAFAKLVATKERERIEHAAIGSVRAAILYEREACAKVCDDIDVEYEGEDVLATWCSRAIRARGEA